MSDKDFLNAPWNKSKLLTRVSVIDRFQDGSYTEEDATYFFNKYRPLIIAVGRKKGLNNEEIKELISCVFSKILAVFEKIAQGEKSEIIYARKHGTHGRFRDYFSRIISNSVADIYREKGRSKFDATEPEQLDMLREKEEDSAPDEDINKIWQYFILREALQDLKEEMDTTQYKVFFQVKMRGKKGPEVAQVFDMTAANVNQICSRTQKKLLAIVKELSEEHPIEKMAEDEMCRFIYQTNKEFQALDDEFAE